MVDADPAQGPAHAGDPEPAIDDHHHRTDLPACVDRADRIDSGGNEDRDAIATLDPAAVKLLCGTAHARRES